MILYSIVQNIISTILSKIKPIFFFCMFKRQKVCGNAQVKAIDALIMKEGFTTSQTIEANRITPSDGMHWIWRRNQILDIVILYRSTTHDRSSRGSDTTEYVLYSRKTSTLDELSENKNKSSRASIVVTNYEALSPWNTTTRASRVYLPGSGANKNQKKAVNKIVGKFKQDNKASVLISGEPGGGKSATGMYLAAALEQEGYKPILYQGINMTCKGVSILNLLPSEIPESTPYILMLDEIDIAFKMAMSEITEGRTDISCIAKTKTSLCNELDRLNDTPNLIICGTTNMTFESLRETQVEEGKDEKKSKESYEAFIRKGRFNEHITF
jgi:hypothetical protein